MKAKKALIMVDLQSDFCKGGQLAVPGGDEVIPIANQLQDYFDIIIATKDWHPNDHISFAMNHLNRVMGDVIEVEEGQQILWPAHCIQHSKGAELHPKLKIEKIHKIIHKGVDKKIDSYSAFFDNAHKRSTGLSDYLNQLQIKDIYIIGLATDYCVKYSVLDALHLGFNVHIIKDACRGVELKPGDIDKAYQEMKKEGAKVLTLADIIPSASTTQ